jgi:hypothetical protein
VQAIFRSLKVGSQSLLTPTSKPSLFFSSLPLLFTVFPILATLASTMSNTPPAAPSAKAEQMVPADPSSPAADLHFDDVDYDSDFPEPNVTPARAPRKTWTLADVSTTRSHCSSPDLDPDFVFLIRRCWLWCKKGSLRTRATTSCYSSASPRWSVASTSALMGSSRPSATPPQVRLL